MSVHSGICARLAAPWRHSGGFTLIELLTVIAIIVLLAALLLPTLTRAKQAGYNTVCINNLRQWGVATGMHLDDCQAYPSTRADGVTDPPSSGMWWRERLGAYAKAGPWLGGWQLGQPGLPTGIDVCPGYLRLPCVFTGACGPYVAYAYNSQGQTPAGNPGVGLMWLVGVDFQSYRSVREAEVVCPGDMVLMGDSYPQSSYIASPPATAFAPFQPGSHWWFLGDLRGEFDPNDMAALLALRQPRPAGPAGGDSRSAVLNAIQRRHRGQWNLVFCDTHVSSLGLPLLANPSSDETFRRWNRDNLPHR